MRVYYVHLQRADFTITPADTAPGVQWQSFPIDLYKNNTYNNYSLVRSSYGLDAVSANPTGIWIGQEWIDSATTDTGIILFSRYVDTSGQINLISYNIVSASYNGNVTLDVYQSSQGGAVFPDEWHAEAMAREVAEGLSDLVKSERYVTLTLHFDYDPGVLDFYMRIEIDTPVMAPKYRETRNLQYKLPSWMAIRELEDGNPATPALSVPQTVGGSVLNAIAGEWLEDLQQQLAYRNLQQYIDTVDIDQMAWCWKTSGLPDFLDTIVGDGIEVSRAVDLNEFYSAKLDDDICFWEENNDTLYTNKKYNIFSLSGKTYTQESHRIWTSLDDLGLLVDLTRIPLEDNSRYQARIKDVYVNQLGAGMNSFKTAIRRELDLWAIYGSTPDSNYVGATPSILEMVDLEADSDYTGPDGMPTAKFTRLVEHLAREYPTTWGQFLWDKAYWDIGGQYHEGFGILPSRMDALPLPKGQTQSGVGSDQDLLVYPPDVLLGPRHSTAKLTVRGKQRTIQTQYPPVDINLTVQGQANRVVYNNPPITVWFTLEFAQYGVAGASVYSFPLTATSDVDVNRSVPSAASYAAFKVFDHDGSTNDSIFLQDRTTGNFVSQRLFSPNLTTVTLHLGQWNVNTQSYTNVPSSDTFSVWLSTNPGQTLVFNSGSTLIVTNPGSNFLPEFSVVMSSKVTSSSLGTWSSEAIPLTVTVNQSSSTTSQLPGTIKVPNVSWDSYLSSTPNMKLVVTLTGLAQVNNYDGSITTLDSSYIRLNGNSTWVNSAQIISPNTASLVFGINAGANYPEIGATWSLFQFNQLIGVSGIIDENGPYNNSIPASSGSTSYLFATANVGRGDFTIPQNSDFVPQWIGVTSSNPEVIMWLDSNAIIEDISYKFQPIKIFARLNPDVDPAWHPQVHAGTFYEGQQEYYMFANPQVDIITGSGGALSGMVRQGAPVIVKSNASTYLRQVCFFDWNASPPALTLFNTEIVSGTETIQLFASYDNIYAVSVLDVTDPAYPIAMPATASTSSNIITLSSITDTAKSYQLTYRVANSFYIDNEYVDINNTPVSYIYFDSVSPGGYSVTYESSTFNSATPVDIALSPLYSTIDEGFIFLSHDEYPLSYVIAHISPNELISDGQDYLILTLNSLDQYGNPKGSQSFSVSTNFGTLDKTTIITDKDGFGVVTLTAGTALLPVAPHAPVDTSMGGQNLYYAGFVYGGAAYGTDVDSALQGTPFVAPPAATPSSATSVGTVTIVGPGGYTGLVNFTVDVLSVPPYRILGVPAQDEIRANLTDMNLIYGRVQDPNYNSVPNAAVFWKKARSTYDLFAASGFIDAQGTVFSDSTGGFTIGPFTSATPSGYWFVSMESSQAGTNIFYQTVGDVAYWYEYPATAFGVENLNGLSDMALQLATPVGYYPPYTNGPCYPAYYDESRPLLPAMPAPTVNWFPPTWYALPYYDQYQLGLLAATPHPYQGPL